MAGDERYEVRLANGEALPTASLWAARHEIARRVAFDTDPVNPQNVLPAEIWKTGPNVFGRGVFVERIETAAELSAIGD
jgi:hypothetical protein